MNGAWRTLLVQFVNNVRDKEKDLFYWPTKIPTGLSHLQIFGVTCSGELTVIGIEDSRSYIELECSGCHRHNLRITYTRLGLEPLKREIAV